MPYPLPAIFSGSLPNPSLPREEDALSLVKETVTPEQVEALEARMLEMPQEEAPVKHHFCNGVYVREVTLPKGSFAIGHAHRADCLNVVLSGSVSVLIEGRVRQISAGDVFVGKAFDRKVGYVRETSVWQTVHATPETELEKLEEALVCKSEAFKNHEKRVAEDRLDYQNAIAELGYTEQEVQAISQNTADQSIVPVEHTMLGRSSRHQIGLFATVDFQPGDQIGLARVAGKRTVAGRYTNHSKTPNAEMVAGLAGTIVLRASQFIPHGCEILVDYRQGRRLADSLSS